MNYHIEHAKYKYGQLTVTGWLTGDTADAETAVWVEDLHGRRLGDKLERIEREDVREALFPQETQCLFGFRIKLPIAAGASFYLCLMGSGQVKKRKSSTREVEREGRVSDSLKARVRECLRGGSGKKTLSRSPMVSDTSVKFSFVVPAYHTEPEHLADLLESIWGQTYENWEICLADGSCESILESCRRKEDPVSRQLVCFLTDTRVKYIHLPENLGIAGNSNAALSLAEGDFVVMVDHDDILTVHALGWLARLLSIHPDADFIYSDSDLTDHDNLYEYNPLYKPAWSPEMLYSANYITHLSVVRTSLLRDLGGWRSEYDGAQDWDLFLRIGERTEQIYHIPQVLYHWRAADGSTALDVSEKPYARLAQLKAVQDHLERRGIQGRPAFADAGSTCIRVEQQGEQRRGDVLIRTAPGVNVSEEAAKELRFWASLPGMGVVCPRLVDAKGRIVSQGILIERDGPTALLAGRFPGTANQLGHTDWYRNHVAAEPACYAVSREVWEQVGPPEEALKELAVLEFCLRVEAGGYRNLMTPFAEVCAQESIVESIRQHSLDVYKKIYKKYQPEESA